MAIAAVPAGAMESVIADCTQKGIKFVVIHAAGFAELGEQGRELQKRVLKIALEAGTRLVGPNCMGVYCPEAGLNTIVELENEDFKPGHVAFCGQSGWASENFIAGGSARGLRFSTVISSGNQADLDLVDYISYFGRDPSTKVICAYAEGIQRPRQLIDSAFRLGPSKPIIIWKSGRSQAGARAALSHSASIAGNQEIWLGGARKAGIIAAEGFEELVDMAVAFSSPPFPMGRKVGIIVEAGGGGIAASDACEKISLEVPPFSADLKDQLISFLKDYLPPFSGLANPLDLVWLPGETAHTICMKSMELIANEVDAILFMTYLPFAMPEWRPKYIETMAHLRDRLNLPIFVVPPYASRGTDGMKDFSLAGLPAFPSLERAARAISATAGYQERVSSF
jgi:acyl-CoA synthetase (NDP forming)